MKKPLLVLVLICSFFLSAHAQLNKVPASKKPIEYKQPDATTLTIILKGDENLHWAETSDGYTLLANKNAGYEYAKLDKWKRLVKSGKLAHDTGKRNKKEISFLRKIPKGLQFSESQIKKSKQSSQLK